jgi:hypothetical protein
MLVRAVSRSQRARDDGFLLSGGPEGLETAHLLGESRTSGFHVAESCSDAGGDFLDPIQDGTQVDAGSSTPCRLHEHERLLPVVEQGARVCLGEIEPTWSAMSSGCGHA